MDTFKEVRKGEVFTARDCRWRRRPDDLGVELMTQDDEVSFINGSRHIVDFNPDEVVKRDENADRSPFSEEEELFVDIAELRREEYELGEMDRGKEAGEGDEGADAFYPEPNPDDFYPTESPVFVSMDVDSVPSHYQSDNDDEENRDD